MSKVFQAFLTGVFFTFILDFFLFLGIFENYIKFHEIDLYYNILFSDNQCLILYAVFSTIIGYVVIYIDSNKLSTIFLGGLFFIVSLTLIPPIGNALGEAFFMQKDVRLQNDKYTFKGDIYYSGRTKITFYDYELDKIIQLEKKDLK